LIQRSAIRRYCGQAGVCLARQNSLLQRLRNPVEPFIDFSDLFPQRFDLDCAGRIHHADSRAALRALNHCKFPALADRRERSELETVSAAFGAGRYCHFRFPFPAGFTSIF
jgi:hypothetical protein